MCPAAGDGPEKAANDSPKSISQQSISQQSISQQAISQQAISQQPLSRQPLSPKTLSPQLLSQLEDVDLVRRAGSGDEAAFAVLIERFGGLVLGLSRRKVGRDDADDVAQDALLHIWRSLPSLREPRAFIGWLSRLVQNRAHRWIQQKQRKRVVLQEARSELLARAQHRSKESTSIETDELVHRLPDEMRLALQWKYIEGHSYEEIGKRLSLSFHQVDYLMRRARAALRKELKRSESTKGGSA